MSDLTRIQEETLFRMVRCGLTIIDNGRVEFSDGTLPPRGVFGRLYRNGWMEKIESRQTSENSFEATYRPTKKAYEYFGESDGNNNRP